MQLEIFSEAETYTKIKPRERFFGYGNLGELRGVHAEFIQTMYPLFGLTNAPQELTLETQRTLPIEESIIVFNFKEGEGRILIGNKNEVLTERDFFRAIKEVVAHETAHYLHMIKLGLENYKGLSGNLGGAIKELTAGLGSQIFFEIMGEDFFYGFDINSRCYRLSKIVSEIRGKRNLLEQICRRINRQEIVGLLQCSEFYDQFRKIKELYKN